MRASSSGERDALLSALVACGADPEPPAWHGLVRVVGTAALADPAVARLWPPQGGRRPPPEASYWRELAQALGGAALRDPTTSSLLAEWLRSYGAGVSTGPGSDAALVPDQPDDLVPDQSDDPVPDQPDAPVPYAPHPATGNTISGDAVLHGPSIQARDVHGGIHFHPSPAQPPPPPPAMPVPRQLPPVTPRFVDREADRTALDALRDQRPAHAPQVLVISGLAGVGKTTFATHWLSAHEGGFPDGMLYADLGAPGADGASGPVSPATVLEAFLIALGAPAVPAGVAQRNALWRSMTSNLRLAVLLDNAFTAAQVRPLLLSAPTGLTVVTSRSHLTGLQVDGAAFRRLEGLPAESAVALLAAAGGGTRVAREPAAAREVVRLCGRLPLAVALASAQLAVRPHRTVSALAELLSRGRGAIDALRVDGEAVMRTALDMSYDVLPGRSAALYRRMGLLPTDRHDLSMLACVAAVDPRSGAAAGEEDDDEADHAVHALVEANLLEETGPSTYRFHDLVRPHARRLGEELEDREQRERALRHFVDWCLSTAVVAEGILTPSHHLPLPDVPEPDAPPTPLDDATEALAWLDTHRNGLMGAVRHCAESGWHTSCWRLTDLLWPLFLRFRPSDLWIEAHRLGLEAARRSGSRPGIGRMLTSGAIGLRNAARYEEAAVWYREALELAVEDGNVRQQAQAVNGLGHVELLADRLDAAREHFEHALRLRESIGYGRGVALSRRRLGQTALAAGDLEAAAVHLRLAEAELAALGESYEANRVRALLGHVLDRAGDAEVATRLLLEALARFRAGDSRSEHWEARCLEWLGRAAESRGDPAEAARCYEDARDLFQRLHPADAERMEDRLRELRQA
ncbi:tetratricopeptide repeat protein [Streptomyces sp. NPDC048057]|uniref:tetratricopeptide repeat protein n=1 Tax=Streptomyces sp. NPDC048057 TaxID=3155628 RepID=UPI0033E10043